MHQTGIISYKYATITDSPQEVRVTDKEILYDIEQWFVLINTSRFIKEENAFLTPCTKEFLLITDSLCKKDHTETYIIYFTVNTYIYNALPNHDSELDWMCF